MKNTLVIETSSSRQTDDLRSFLKEIGIKVSVINQEQEDDTHSLSVFVRRVFGGSVGQQRRRTLG